MRYLASAIALLCLSVPAYSQQVRNVAPAEAQRALRSFIPATKKSAVVDAYIISSKDKIVSLGTSCSYSTSENQATGNLDTNGGCDNRALLFRTLFIALPDPANGNGVYVLRIRCDVKWRWNHCEAPPASSSYPVVLAAEKHGAFEIDLGVIPKLGDKPKVAKYAVLGVQYATVKQP